MADVEIKYNNATIASLNDSGTEVLETNGTFLTDDITVEYTKSGGGGVQTTAITATISKGTAYYTDANGTVQTVTTSTVPMPGSPPTISDNAISGSLFVCISTNNVTEISGLTLVTKYDHGSGSTTNKRYTHIYQVD